MIQEIGFITPESGWPSSWQCYYMLGTTTKLSVPFQSNGVIVTLERNILHCLKSTVTEINIKKSTETRLKKLIGASLSEPHTSVTALRMWMCSLPTGTMSDIYDGRVWAEFQGSTVNNCEGETWQSRTIC